MFASFMEEMQTKNRLGKPQTTRQVTLESAFGRIPTRPALKDASNTPSLTTGASLTDNSSEVNEEANKADENGKGSARHRPNVSSFNESSLTNHSTSPMKASTVNTSPAEISPAKASPAIRHSTPHLPKKPSPAKSFPAKMTPTKAPPPREGRSLSVATERAEKRAPSPGELLERSVQALNKAWNIGRLPGDGLLLSPKPAARNSPVLDDAWDSEDMPSRKMQPVPKTVKVEKKESPPAKRASILMKKASRVVQTTRSALGKRTRDTKDAVKDEPSALYGMTTSRLRSRDQKAASALTDQHVHKKVRIAEDSGRKASSEPSIPLRTSSKKPKKLWLSQGLYVGQQRDFDAKFTESENKSRHSKSASFLSEPNSIMPPPMFGGQRLLERGRDFKLPFDVFSPLPPGQPKPDEWKKTQKNVFIGDAAAVWKKSKSSEVSLCICTPESGCDENCFNRFMLYECDENNCSLGPELCTNRAFAGLKQRQKKGGKYNVGVEVLKTADRGYGIRANRTFAPNQIIVEYTGEIITQDECESRMRGRYKNAECYYLMDFDQGMILDATRGSIARFVNHSCSPNCRMIKWTVQGKPRMALFAGDNGIMTAEELTYDYNFNPYSMKNVQECRCGAENCRGVLGPKPKEIKDALNPIANGGKRKIQQVVEDAVEGVKQAAKKRKLNVPVPSAVRNLVSKATEKVQGGKKEKSSSNKKKALPLGWVYIEDMEEAPPPLIRNVFGTDPEALMRSAKRKIKAEDDESKPNQRPKQTPKSQGTARRGSSGDTLTAKGSRDGSKNKISRETEQRKRPGSVNGRRSLNSKTNSVRKNVVRTIKGRNGTQSGTPGKKSIRFIDGH